MLSCTYSCAFIQLLLLVCAGKLAPRHLTATVDKALACWAAEAMLQFLFLLLHKLSTLQQIANSTSHTAAEVGCNTNSCPSSAAKAFAPSPRQPGFTLVEISDRTYAEVPLSSLAEVNAVIGETLPACSDCTV